METTGRKMRIADVGNEDLEIRSGHRGVEIVLVIERIDGVDVVSIDGSGVEIVSKRRGVGHKVRIAGETFIKHLRWDDVLDVEVVKRVVDIKDWNVRTEC